MQLTAQAPKQNLNAETRRMSGCQTRARASALVVCLAWNLGENVWEEMSGFISRSASLCFPSCVRAQIPAGAILAEGARGAQEDQGR